MSSNSRKRKLSDVIAEDKDGTSKKKRRIQNTPKISDLDESSENEEYYVFDVLKECSLINTLDVEDDVILLIVDFAAGEIIECCYCSKEDHMDDDVYYKRENTDKWVFINYSDYETELEEGETICRSCYMEHHCTLCEENWSEDNYKCDVCEEVICYTCEINGFHFNVHCDNNLELTDNMM